MYKVLKTSSRTLITVDEVIYAAPTMDNVDERFINTSIQIAEARFAKPSLCSDLYYDFRDKKNQVVTTINKSFLESLFPSGTTLNEGEIVNSIDFVSNTWYVELWNEILWKVIAEAVTYIAEPVNFSRFTSQGEMQNNPKNPLESQQSATVNLDTIEWKTNKLLQDRIDPLRAVLDEWLFNNRVHFPLANCKNWGVSRTPNGVSMQRKTAWVFGVYDNNQSTKCGCDDRRDS